MYTPMQIGLLKVNLRQVADHRLYSFLTMNFHIVKMYKDKEVNKNVKDIFFYQCVT